jgi:hypothetical protein
MRKKIFSLPCTVLGGEMRKVVLGFTYIIDSGWEM